ncbi:MAG: class I tRNA ligase family protein, partial [Bdellovibrionaceae bacterium]|nr:class I tRNA ligase family protein [Pseudobdellovibrionaceae bacterium]
PSEDRKATQLILAQVLNRMLRLLHPFCPFITEELYQKLPIKNSACIIDQYPTILNDRELLDLASVNAAKEIDLIKEVITAIRNIRGENRISPAEKLKIRLAVNDEKTQKIIGENKSTIQSIARVEITSIGDAGNISKCAVNTATTADFQAKVIIPLEGLVDFDEEIKRITKTIEKLTKDIGILTGKLSNEKFLSHAEEDVIENDKILLEQSKIQIQSLQEALLRFQN